MEPNSSTSENTSQLPTPSEKPKPDISKRPPIRQQNSMPVGRETSQTRRPMNRTQSMQRGQSNTKPSNE